MSDDFLPPQAPTPTIILIGLRGSGKTVIGRSLAARLGLPFTDLDQRTPLFAGEKTVADVFKNQGEAAFRGAEARALEAVIEEPARVLALGGGTPTSPGAADLLRRAREERRAEIVYLRARAETLRARLASADNAHRPPLTPGATDALAEIPEILARRDPLYRELASHVLETDSISAPVAVSFLAARLGNSVV